MFSAFFLGVLLLGAGSHAQSQPLVIPGQSNDPRSDDPRYQALRAQRDAIRAEQVNTHLRQPAIPNDESSKQPTEAQQQQQQQLTEQQQQQQQPTETQERPQPTDPQQTPNTAATQQQQVVIQMDTQTQTQAQTQALQTPAPAPVPVPVQHYVAATPKEIDVEENWLDRDGVRIYDAMLFAYEVDALVIHLNELKDAVDFFIIVEADKTFTGKPRDLVFPTIKLDSILKDKVLYFVAEQSNSGDAWGREHSFRQQLVANQALRAHKYAPRQNDIIIIADADEITSAKAVHMLRKNVDKYEWPVTLCQRFYYVSYEFRQSYYNWCNVFAAKYDPNLNLDDIRRNDRFRKTKLTNAGWHCSSCFASIDDFTQKLSSFSHTEYSGPAYTNVNIATVRTCIGFDLFDRRDVGEGGLLQRSFPVDAPRYVLANPDKYMYLLDRANTEACRTFRKRAYEFLLQNKDAVNLTQRRKLLLDLSVRTNLVERVLAERPRVAMNSTNLSRRS